MSIPDISTQNTNKTNGNYSSKSYRPVVLRAKDSNNDKFLSSVYKPEISSKTAKTGVFVSGVYSLSRLKKVITDVNTSLPEVSRSNKIAGIAAGFILASLVCITGVALISKFIGKTIENIVVKKEIKKQTEAQNLDYSDFTKAVENIAQKEAREIQGNEIPEEMLSPDIGVKE